MKAWLTQGRRGRREDYEKHHCRDLAGPEREYNPQITSIDADWGRQGRGGSVEGWGFGLQVAGL